MNRGLGTLEVAGGVGVWVAQRGRGDGAGGVLVGGGATSRSTTRWSGTGLTGATGGDRRFGLSEAVKRELSGLVTIASREEVRGLDAIRPSGPAWSTTRNEGRRSRGSRKWTMAAGFWTPAEWPADVDGTST